MSLKDIPLYNFISFGNSKLPKTTAIFNLGTATNCINRGTERCQVPANQCYAYKTEQRWNNVLEYRKQQSIYWDGETATSFINDFNRIRNSKRNNINAIRFNVSSDIRNRSDIVKIDKIAERLNIPVYTYSASSHVNFSGINNVIIQCSNSELFNKYGEKDNFGTFRVVDNFNNVPDKYSDFKHCHGDCSECNHCLNARNVIVEKH